MPFAEVINDQAYLKAGFMGLQGSGKTYTAAQIAIGLHKLLAERKIIAPKLPVYALDSETGSTWLKPMFEKEGIRLFADKTKAFPALVRGCQEVAKQKGILLIDSITHFWREICDAYAKEKRRRKLEFQDWGTIKAQWQQFTDLYVNGTFHCVMCGRQGYEYDMYVDEDDGKRKIEKSGLKMKAETETGYEPNLLVVMERHQELDTNGVSVKEVWRTAYVLKDRADLIDGKSFKNPTFNDFAPHVNTLNLGGEHVGVDTSETSQGTFPRDDTGWRYEKEQKEVMLAEFQGLAVKHYPSQSGDDKKAKAALVFEIFGCHSWEKVQQKSLEEIKDGFHKAYQKLEGKLPGQTVSLTQEASETF